MPKGSNEKPRSTYVGAVDGEAAQVTPPKPLILFFNDFFGCPPATDFPCADICAFTTDRDRFDEAAAVVFHVPTLTGIDALEKPSGQLWVAWSMESCVNYPKLADGAFMRNFDIRMTYEQSADIWCPYLPYERAFDRALARPLAAKTAEASTVMFQSDDFDRSGRNAFLRELMQHLRVDSYGSFLNNRQLAAPDRGRETKLDLIAGYKFCIGFENSIAPDYVTEKFFDPLLAGSVPVYRGAPNAGLFAPGPDAFIDVSDFSGPRQLAEFLVHLDHDDRAYRRYLAWRETGLSDRFRALLVRRGAEPFCSLCRTVAGMQS